MKALSIRQPWAWAIIHAGKDIENRTWKTNFRGRIYVHAAKTFDNAGYKQLVAVQEKLPPIPDDFMKGGIVGTVDIVDCVERSDSPWFDGGFMAGTVKGLVLENPEPCEFILSRGRLGFFEPDI